jgi:DNA-binding beta-propeller fold protein YncE/phospholipase C
VRYSPLCLTLLAYCLSAQVVFSQNTTAEVDDQFLPTGQRIAPAGETLEFADRPVDACLGPEGRLLFVKGQLHLRIIDTHDFKLVQTLECPEGTSLFGIAADVNGVVYVTNSERSIHVYAPVESATNAAAPAAYRLDRTTDLPEDSYPCGIALSKDGETAYVCLSKLNQLGVVHLRSGELRQTIDVGVAPFGVAIDEDSLRLAVSNIGGRRPNASDQTAPSAGTPTVVDKRGIASTGAVSMIDLTSLKVVAEYPTGRHPSALLFLPGGERVLCANSNDDTLTVVDLTSKTAKDLVVKPDAGLPFGSMPAAVAVGPQTGDLFVALAGNNVVAKIDRDELRSAEEHAKACQIEGLLPTAWFPSAVVVGSKHLYVACTKGRGSRAAAREPAEGRNAYDYQAVVQRIALSDIEKSEQLASWSDVARQSARTPAILQATHAMNATGADSEAVPVPKRLGDASCLKHVIYVIKENRTYDQMFGDIANSRADPALCVFPERLSPNHHALARRFGVLDNYYCNGVLSADGHSWATEGNVTPYLERAFGGFARSYTFGDDPITYSSSGFLWDHFLDAGLSFRNYGEMDYAEPPEGYDLLKLLEARQRGEHITFQQNIGVQRLRRYSCRDYPGWNMEIPDVLRVDRFLAEFREFEKTGGLPQLSIVYLPQDHFGGPVTSQAHMADNDLAVGRLVEAISRSKYWKDTVLFINEDDPQNGYDHIDGHRSICLVVSPYSRAGVNHDFFNQNSVLRTILHIFGLPPMNQQNAFAPLMTSCFQTQAVTDPYEAIVPETPLDQRPKPTNQQSQLERQWRRTLATVPIERTGMKTEKDDDNLNRFVWHEVRGWEAPYPAEFAGFHATGLKSLGLVLDAQETDDD